MQEKKSNIVTHREETGKIYLELSSVYKYNCSDQKHVEITNDVLQAYLDFEEADEHYRDWRRNHINKFVTSEEALQQDNMLAIFDEDYYLDRIFVEMLKEKCGERTYIRAVLYYLYGMSVTEIAKREKVSNSAIDKSLEKAAKVLAKIYNIPYDSQR